MPFANTSDFDPFFLFTEPLQTTCVADIADDATFEVLRVTCSLDRNHMRSGKRLSDLNVIIPSDSAPDVFFTWGRQCLIRDKVEQIFADERLTGFSARAARARLSNGSPVNVSELIVTGWAGMAPEASGIREVEHCPGCGFLRYSALEEPQLLIDEKRWDGSDFFMVWPLPMFRFVTKRVVDVCRKYQLTGVSLEQSYPDRGIRPRTSGYGPGRLSYYMPVERAHLLGDSLGIF